MNIHVRKGAILTLTLVLVDGTREEGYLPTDFKEGVVYWRFEITRTMMVVQAQVYADGKYVTNNTVAASMVSGDTYEVSVKVMT